MRYYITEYTFQSGTINRTVGIQPKAQTPEEVKQRWNARALNSARRFNVSPDIMPHRLLSSVRFIIVEEVTE